MSMSHDPQQQPQESMPVPSSLLPEVLQRLGLSKDASSQDTIVTLIEDMKRPEWYVRANAVRKLGMFGAQAPLELLLAALDDPHVSVRANAVRALGQLPEERVPLERVQQALQDSEWQVRESAIIAAEQLGKLVPIASLQAAAWHDPDEMVREAAQRVLQRHYPEEFPAGAQRLPPATAVTRLISSIREIFTLRGDEHKQQIVLREGNSMQDTNYSTRPMSRVDGASPQARPPRRSKPARGPLWRTVGVSLAVIVVAINIVGWLLLTHSVQPHTQTGAGSGGQDTATAGVMPTSAAIAPGKTLYTYTPTYSASQPGSPDDMMSLGWSSDGKYIAVSAFDVTLLDAKSGKTVISLGGGNASAWVSWSPDGTRLITSSQDAKIWDVKTQRTLVTYTPAMNTAYQPPSSGNPMIRLSGGNMIYASSFSPDEKQVASAVNGNAYGFNVQIWDPTNGNHLRTLQIKANATAGDYINDVAWSPDGKYLAVASPNNGVSIWDTASWKIMHTLQGDGGITWAPKGDLIAATMGNNSVEVWNASTGQGQYSFQGQADQQGIDALSWSPDGRYIAVSGHDVRIWNTSTHKLFYIYTGHGNSPNLTIRSLAWSPDSTSIASLGTGMDVLAPHIGKAFGAVKVWIAG
jgi:Tol biopolymer transport system component